MPVDTSPLSYGEAGVDTESQDLAMSKLTSWITCSFSVREGRSGSVKLPLGYFANVIEIGNGLGLAVSTDGVGTKIIVAQMLGKYDTIGIDCVAMNVNDVLCVGAEPLALLDYIAVEHPHPDLLEALAKGLYAGAEQAEVSIPGGEIAQVKEMVHGIGEDGYGFDLVGTCIGKVQLDRILTGEDIKDGDVLIGLRSSGIHSNGLTLARVVFFDRMVWGPDRHVDELGRTIGEELLEPTKIYVKEVLAMIQAGLNIKALAHITGSGFLNLIRCDSTVRFVLDDLPEPQPIFNLIQSCGHVTEEEMFLTYNMGIGFCIVVDPADADRVQDIAHKYGVESHAIGYAVTAPEKQVTIPARRLIGRDGRFFRS